MLQLYTVFYKYKDSRFYNGDFATLHTNKCKGKCSLYICKQEKRDIGAAFIVRAKPCLPLWSFSLIRKTELWKTNKPPAMQVSQHCFSLQKKTSGGIINVGSPTALIYTGGIHMDNNSLSHTKWNCKYHIGATCGRCLKCAHALSPPFVIFLPRNA